MGNCNAQQCGGERKLGISASQIISHNNEKDLWTIIEGNVYDLTDYFKSHPGGAQVILNFAGKDSTDAFISANHSSQAIEEMKKYWKGAYVKPTKQEEEILKILEKRNEENLRLKQLAQNGGGYSMGNDIEDVQVDEMHCYQCSQTTNGTGCTFIGVCGKTPKCSALQDLILHYIKGIASYAHRLKIESVPYIIVEFCLKVTFSTLTNVNFNDYFFFEALKQANIYRNMLKEQYERTSLQRDDALNNSPAKFVYRSKQSYLIAEAKKISIRNRQMSVDADVLGLNEMLQYGMKGLSAYFFHAEKMRAEFPNAYTDEDAHSYLKEYFRLYAGCAEQKNFTMEKQLQLNLDAGKLGVDGLKFLDQAHNHCFGSPTPTEVTCSPIEGKCILLSGHDMLCLYHLLQQTQGTGINVYTHSEMLPAHAYPKLKQFSHLRGNFGGAYHQQQNDFTYFPGAILLTSNCLLPPQDAYKDRLFTTSAVGWAGIKHIDGTDYTSVISCALQQDGFTQNIMKNLPIQYMMPKETVGFGHKTVLGIADKVVGAIKSGAVKRIYLIGGCDSPGEKCEYSREAALAAQKDSLVLTLGCTKYRLRDLNLGTTGGLPRLLDLGQCNDSYSAVVIAMALAKALNTDVHSLPLHLLVSWMEQKAVIILLSLLYLGFKNIHLGPILPGFLTPNLVKFLVDKYNLKLQGNAHTDVYNIEHNKN